MFGKKRALVAVALVAGSAAIPAMAHHQWQNFAWASDGVSPIAPPVVDNTDRRWSGHVSQAVADWNVSPVIESGLEYGNNSSCAMTTGTIQVCNADYGDNGWLGLATISHRDGTIVAGSTKLNDNFFNRPKYDNYTWRQLVTCQEIGHDYGLTHQNEDFSTDLTTSCMEYTSLPEGNEQPDAHDYEELARMYGGTTSGGGKGGKGNGKGRTKPRMSLPPVGNTPSTWGRPTAFLPNGKPYRYIKNVGNYTYVTHVTWAPDDGHGDHDH